MLNGLVTAIRSGVGKSGLMMGAVWFPDDRRLKADDWF
jgi:hypothetical protein